MLDQWIEDQQYETDQLADLSARVKPQDFIEWAEDAFGQSLPSFRPQWLEHFVFRALGTIKGQLPPPIPNEMVTRGIDLENRVKPKTKGKTHVQSNAGRRSEVTPELGRAFQALVDAGVTPGVGAVRDKLHEMVKGGRGGSIVRVEALNIFYIDSSSQTETPYKKAALVRWVNRNLEKLRKEEDLRDA